MSRQRHGRIVRTVLFGIVAAAAAVTCVNLGFWQLDRLNQRRAQNALIRERSRGDAVSVESLRGEDTTVTHWRRARLVGRADYERELVQALRSQNGAPGVHLLTPVAPSSGEWGDTMVLVIRGFVAAPDGRVFDRVAAREGDSLDIEGLVTIFPPPRPGNVRLPSDSTAVRWLDRDSLTALIGRPLAPYVLLALGDTVVRDVKLPARVPPPALSEGNHLSYAFQWFAFATVAVGGFAAYLFEERRRSRRTDEPAES